MIKLCGTLLCKPLKIIFKSCITKSEFPSKCKKAVSWRIEDILQVVAWRFNFGILEIYYYGISGNLMQLVKSFLKNCKQRVVLNGQASSWSNVQAGASQGYSWSNFFLNLYQWPIR